MKILLDNNKNYYKANLHCHTNYSDGKLSPEEIKKAYKEHGYSIVAFTDHEHIIDHSYLNDENFLAITSCELTIKEFPGKHTMKFPHMKVCHLNFYALDPHNDVTPCYSYSYDEQFIKSFYKDKIKFESEYERFYTPESINEMIRIGKEKGFIVSYNHPSWSCENALQYLHYDDLFAVEIYNHDCAQMGILTDEHVYDDMLRAGKKLFCSACDDNHNKLDFDNPNQDSFGGWVCINAEKLDYKEIMNALQSGNFYASSGPAIFSLTRDGDKVTVQTSACKRIQLVTATRRCGSFTAKDGETLTNAEFLLSETDGYFRIRAVDENGNIAFSQAYPYQN